MPAGASDGFVLVDDAESSSTSYENKFDSRERTNPAELVVTFG
jgi:hypothetical protein